MESEEKPTPEMSPEIVRGLARRFKNMVAHFFVDLEMTYEEEGKSREFRQSIRRIVEPELSCSKHFSDPAKVKLFKIISGKLYCNKVHADTDDFIRAIRNNNVKTAKLKSEEMLPLLVSVLNHLSERGYLSKKLWRKAQSRFLNPSGMEYRANCFNELASRIRKDEEYKSVREKALNLVLDSEKRAMTDYD